MNNLQSKIFIGIAVTLVTLLIGWFIMEFTHTRTFYGTLANKYTNIYYTYDEERTETHVDSDGHVSYSHRGSDETTAHINYVLEFYCNGTVRTVSAGNYSASVPYIHADAMALRKLYNMHTEPAHYTYTQLKEEYSVVVRGWLLDGCVKDITLMKLMPKESN